MDVWVLEDSNVSQLDRDVDDSKSFFYIFESYLLHVLREIRRNPAVSMEAGVREVASRHARLRHLESEFFPHYNTLLVLYF